jgi:hypothetical protein
VSDIDTAVVDGLKVLDPNGRLEKLGRWSARQLMTKAVIERALLSGCTNPVRAPSRALVQGTGTTGSRLVKWSTL